jgi:lipopolysaccharide export system permease protein
VLRNTYYELQNTHCKIRNTQEMKGFLKILDKYIIKKYLSTFGFVLLIFSLIACVIDFSEKVEDFIKKPITKKEIFIDYYLNFIPHINLLLFPLYALIAVIFFTSRMASNSEVISILNAGVSFKRLMRPYLVAAGLIVVLHLVLAHILVPIGNKKRLAIEHKYIWVNQDKGKTENVHMYLDPDTKVYINYYRKSDTTIRDFRIEKYNKGELVSILKASDGSWLGYPNKWRLQQVQKRTFNGMFEHLEGPVSILDTTINLIPEDFVRYAEQNEMLTTAELRQEIGKLEKRGVGNTKGYEIEIHRRTAEPFTIVILTLIGMSLAARKVRGGIGLHLAMGIGIGAIFIFLSKFAVTFATQPDVPAIVGVWIPNIIFSIVAFLLMSNAQK